MREPRYFIAWVSEDNVGKPNMPYLTARKEYMFRVFREDFDNSSAAPITEAMTYDEAEAKKREIWLLTKGELA
jgi:hypothetical protein